MAWTRRSRESGSSAAESRRGPNRRSAAHAAGALSVLGALLLAVAPVQASPFFSLEGGGPSEKEGTTIFEGDVSNPVIVGSDIGADDDELNAFSGDQSLDRFCLCFSVDPASEGAKDPAEIDFLASENVKTQAEKNQQAGDAFLGTEKFNRDGIIDPPADPEQGDSQGEFNNALAFNQSGDFGLKPEAGAKATASGDQDNIDGGSLADVTEELFFSLTEESPSNPASGATIFVGAGITAPFLDDPAVFATPPELGLQADDELDSITVFDHNDNGDFDRSDDGTDQVLFSLAPDSPSLEDLAEDIAEAAAAAVFSVSAEDDPPDEPNGQPVVFAEPEDLGLGAGDDNITMLALVETAEKAEAPVPGSFALLGIGLVMLPAIRLRRAARRGRES